MHPSLFFLYFFVNNHNILPIPIMFSLFLRPQPFLYFIYILSTRKSSYPQRAELGVTITLLIEQLRQKRRGSCKTKTNNYNNEPNEWKKRKLISKYWSTWKKQKRRGKRIFLRTNNNCDAMNILSSSHKTSNKTGKNKNSKHRETETFLCTFPSLFFSNSFIVSSLLFQIKLHRRVISET